MAAISTWSTTAASNNQATPDGFPEGQNPGSINDCARTMMAAIRAWYEGAQWLDFGHTPTKTSSNTFTVSGDQTAVYDVGRRLKFTGSASGYDTISASSYSAPNTTVTLTTSPISGTLTAVAVGILSGTNSAIDLTAYAKYADTTANFTGTLENAGKAVAVIDSGSFTGTLTACSGANGTIQWRKSGNKITLNAPSDILGTSTAGTLTMTGLPAGITPALNAQQYPCSRVWDNGTALAAEVQIGVSGVLTFYAGFPGSNASFTSSGQKGIKSGWSISYDIG